MWIRLVLSTAFELLCFASSSPDGEFLLIDSELLLNCAFTVYERCLDQWQSGILFSRYSRWLLPWSDSAELGLSENERIAARSSLGYLATGWVGVVNWSMGGSLQLNRAHVSTVLMCYLTMIKYNIQALATAIVLERPCWEFGIWSRRMGPDRYGHQWKVYGDDPDQILWDGIRVDYLILICWFEYTWCGAIWYNLSSVSLSQNITYWF